MCKSTHDDGTVHSDESLKVFDDDEQSKDCDKETDEADVLTEQISTERLRHELETQRSDEYIKQLERMISPEQVEAAKEAATVVFHTVAMVYHRKPVWPLFSSLPISHIRHSAGHTCLHTMLDSLTFCTILVL